MSRREINLLGGFYKDASLPWSAQDTVNWLPVQAQSEGTRSPMKLRGVPGLKGLSQSVIPLPQWTTWDAASIIGPGELENGDRTFFRVGANPTEIEGNATTGYARVKGRHPITGPARYYFEVYSELPVSPEVTPSPSIRFGVCRLNVPLGEGNAGHDVLTTETSWKFSALGNFQGVYHIAGGVNTAQGRPIPVSGAPSSWAGFAIEASGDINSVLSFFGWMVMDGVWAYNGQNPTNTPNGSSIISRSFNTADVLGGIVPYAALYRPRSVNREFVVRANFGQEPFRIGDAAFAPGGVLAGFTKGWPSS